MPNYDDSIQNEEKHINQDDTQALVYQANFSRLLKRMDKIQEDDDREQHQRVDELR